MLKRSGESLHCGWRRVGGVALSSSTAARMAILMAWDRRPQMLFIDFVAKLDEELTGKEPHGRVGGGTRNLLMG